MAHKKAGGSSRNGRDSQAKRLGVKKYGGEAINAGGIRMVLASTDRTTNVAVHDELHAAVAAAITA